MSLLLWGLAAAGVAWAMASSDDDERPAGPPVVTLSDGTKWTFDILPHPKGGFIAMFGRYSPGFQTLWRRAPDDPYATREAADAVARKQIGLFDPTATDKVSTSGSYDAGAGVPVQWRVRLDNNLLFVGEALDDQGQWIPLVLGQMEPRKTKLLMLEQLGQQVGES
jgi:hypothetical protein